MVASSAAALLLDLLCSVFSCLLLLLNAITHTYHSFTDQPLKLQPNNLIIVITGCDSGFGELLSVRFTQLGFKVVSGCLTEEGVTRLSSVVTKAVRCDVTKEIDIQNLVQNVETVSSTSDAKLWAVVNNAGIADGGAVDWTELSIWRKVMEVNFFSVVSVTRAMLPLLKRSPESRSVSAVYASLVCSFDPLSGSSTSHLWRGLSRGLPWEPIVLRSMLLKEWRKHCDVS
jgi:hypothetical protein